MLPKLGPPDWSLSDTGTMMTRRMFQPLRDEFSLKPREFRVIAGEIDRRDRRVTWWPQSLSIGVCIAWMVLFGQFSDMVEGTRWDFTRYALKSTLSAILVLSLNMGMAFLLAIGMYYGVRRRLLRRRLHAILTTPLCIWCGYDLRARPIEEGRIFCVECGQTSYAAQARVDDASAS